MFIRTLVVLSVVAYAGSADAQDSWESGFEQGFPGEFLSYDDGSWSSSGNALADRSATWTIVNRASGEPVFSGDHAYKGFVTRAADASHRAYPVLHTDMPTPLVNSFMVWLDADFDALGERDWVHFGTWGNNPDWVVHTMSVRNGLLEMAHLDWRWVGDSPQPAFPLRRWVRLTVYLHYPPVGDGTVVVWQDGERVMEGTYSARPGANLQRVHWGMYARNEVDHGVQYNDDIRLWRLPAPLTDFSSEPQPPDGPFPPPEPEPEPGVDAGRPARDAGTSGPGAGPDGPDRVASGGCAAAGAGSAAGSLVLLALIVAWRRIRT